MEDLYKHNQQLSAHAFELVKDQISNKDAKMIAEFIYDVNEWGLGLETLIDVLLEEEIAITSEQKIAILTAANAMNIDRGQSILEEIVKQDRNAT